MTGSGDTKPQSCFCLLNDFLPECLASITGAWNGILPWQFMPCFWFVSLFRARREISDAREILFGQRSLRLSYIWNFHISIFLSTVLLKLVIKKCVSSLKRNQERSQEVLIDYSKIYFLWHFSCFYTLLFPPLLQLAFFDQSYFRWHWKFPLGTVQRAFRKLKKLDWVYVTKYFIFV